MSTRPASLIEVPLLRTKIAIPQSPLGVVSRPRLTGQVQRGVAGPLTLLAAPAGFGKTHLLIEWCRSAGLPVAWLTLDSDDNDPGRFFRYLVGALQTVETGLGDEALVFFQPSQERGLEVGLTLLINEKLYLTWEPRYLIYPGPGSLLPAALALTEAGSAGNPVLRYVKPKLVQGRGLKSHRLD